MGSRVVYYEYKAHAEYDDVKLTGNEDLQMLFNYRRQFPEVRTTELFAEIVDPLASSGCSAPNPHLANVETR
ncbi:hypothetical protein PIB30_051565 [Stylosanthes scabra]|uniref:Uncharacterized protein n=1 Tax=Stylosanthes scabra TaxID=79078 RepID=A0ABU6RIC1_9FABA|nr:hypothetical protein [Stylosanthes scabra]